MPDQNSRNEDFIYFDCTCDDVTKMAGAQLNDKYMFFWNEKAVWKIDLDS